MQDFMVWSDWQLYFREEDAESLPNDVIEFHGDVDFDFDAGYGRGEEDLHTQGESRDTKATDIDMGGEEETSSRWQESACSERRRSIVSAHEHWKLTNDEGPFGEVEIENEGDEREEENQKESMIQTNEKCILVYYDG